MEGSVKDFQGASPATRENVDQMIWIIDSKLILTSMMMIRGGMEGSPTFMAFHKREH